jgi:hypothetical protein
MAQSGPLRRALKTSAIPPTATLRGGGTNWRYRPVAVIMEQQKARSFELRAALSLAKLYQSPGRPTDAHNVLAPALQGLSPTPEFPAIEEAQSLFEALAHL